MPTRIGTSHFRSLMSANRYYAKQHVGLLNVKRKVDAGEIHIGKPEVPANHRCYLDSDGRYWLEELPSKLPKDLPHIRFIVETVTSERDRNGNCYHFARVTSTVTGKTLCIAEVGGTTNARWIVTRSVSNDGHYPVHTVETTLPKRQWQHCVPKDAPRENDVTFDMIRALETRG